MYFSWFTYLKFEDRLDGETNFYTWNAMVNLILEENEVCNILDLAYLIPPNEIMLVSCNKKNVKPRELSLKPLNTM